MLRKGCRSPKQARRAGQRAAGEDDEAGEDDRERALRQNGGGERHPERPEPAARSGSALFTLPRNTAKRDASISKTGKERVDLQVLRLPEDDRRDGRGRARDERLALAAAPPREPRGARRRAPAPARTDGRRVARGLHVAARERRRRRHRPVEEDRLLRVGLSVLVRKEEALPLEHFPHVLGEIGLVRRPEVAPRRRDEVQHGRRRGEEKGMRREPMPLSSAPTIRRRLPIRACATIAAGGPLMEHNYLHTFRLTVEGLPEPRRIRNAPRARTTSRR